MNKEQILSILERENISVSVFALYLTDKDQALYLYCDNGYGDLEDDEFYECMKKLVDEEIKVINPFIPENSIYAEEVIFQSLGNTEYFRIIGESSSYGTTYEDRIDVVKPYEIIRVNYLTDKEYEKTKK